MLRSPGHRHQNKRVRTNHASLLIYQRAQVVEYLRQFMDARFNLPNLSLSFLDERLLVGQFMRRQLLLKYLCLTLLLRGRLRFIGVAECASAYVRRQDQCQTIVVHVRGMMVLVVDGQLNPSDYRPLPLRTDLLRPLECDERHLQVVRCLLERCLLVGLENRSEHRTFLVLQE